MFGFKKQSKVTIEASLEGLQEAFGVLLAITSLVVGVLAVGFTIVSEVGGLVALLVAVVAFFVGLGLMGVYKALAELLCLDY